MSFDMFFLSERGSECDIGTRQGRHQRRADPTRNRCCWTLGMPPLDVPAPKAAEKLNVARLQREQMMEHVSQSLFRLVDTLKGKGERVWEMMTRLDQNGDGTLSYQEIRWCLKDMKVNLSAEEQNILVHAFDQDNSGQIDYVEFYNVLTGITEAQAIISKFDDSKLAAAANIGAAIASAGEEEVEMPPRTFPNYGLNPLGTTYGTKVGTTGWIFPEDQNIQKYETEAMAAASPGTKMLRGG